MYRRIRFAPYQFIPNRIRPTEEKQNKIFCKEKKRIYLWGAYSIPTNEVYFYR